MKHIIKYKSFIKNENNINLDIEEPENMPEEKVKAPKKIGRKKAVTITNWNKY